MVLNMGQTFFPSILTHFFFHLCVYLCACAFYIVRTPTDICKIRTLRLVFKTLKGRFRVETWSDEGKRQDIMSISVHVFLYIRGRALGG